MRKHTMLVGLAFAVLLSVICVGGVFSQQAAPGRGGGGGGGRGGRMDPAQMLEMMMERIQEQMGATEEEWKVLGPRIEKVYTLSRQTGGGAGMRGLFGRRGTRAPEPEGAAGARELSPVEKAVEGLREVVENEAATSQQITQKLTALREAREKVKQQLSKAQGELRQVLSVRQEAQLVLAGLLE